MTRQALGPKKLRRLRKKTGLPVTSASVRGGENHSTYAVCEDGSRVLVYKDGRVKYLEVPTS